MGLDVWLLGFGVGTQCSESHGSRAEAQDCCNSPMMVSRTVAGHAGEAGLQGGSELLRGQCTLGAAR